MPVKITLQLVAALGLILIGLIVVLDGYFTVAPNERVVVTRLGKIVRSADSGFHFKMPFAESTRTFRIDIQDLAPKEGVNTYTIDNQEVDVIFNVFYKVDPNKVEFIYVNVPDFRQRLYIMAIDRLKAAMGKVNVMSVAEKRAELRDTVRETLQHDSASLGLEVTDFQLTNLEYTKSFREAVNAAAVQKANIESREYERQQAEKTAQKVRIEAEGVANALREQAKGEADANISRATAEARAIQMKGEGEAAAILAQAKALASNPELVNLRRVERWNGVLPQNIYAGAPIPFFDTGRGK